MGKLLKWLDRFWYPVVLIGVVGVQAVVFLVFREDSYLTVQDNLDLFVAHFQVLNHWEGWFGPDKTLPLLGGVARNCLGSEFSLYNIAFAFLPPFWAYMVGYFLKILIGATSFALLAKEVCRENFGKYRGLAWVVGLCYGILPLFPAYGIAFASIPLVIWILWRIYTKGRVGYYIALFFYPLLSYFSYFGFFLLAYLVCGILILSFRDRKICKRLLAALPVLAAGYICFEYRLFAQMLFSDVVTIRASMVDTDLSFWGILGQIGDAFLQPVFHASSDHAVFVLPVCLLFVGWTAFRRIVGRQKESKAARGVFWILLLILFNCVVNGLYFWGDFRRLFERLLPPLKGFQFNRTTFFNPFLWYAAFFLTLCRIQDKGRLFWTRLANFLACVATLVILVSPAVYNEFYNTVYHQAWRAVKHAEPNMLNFREYYSSDLFDRIKEDIAYDGAYGAGYGLNPAVLSYNGIATLDGYLGFYPQSYKEEFTKLILPAYERVEEWRIYYGEWGARAYLYPGSGESIYNPYRNQPLSDSRLWLDGDQFRKMGGRYLFSRYELDNMEELGFSLRSVYEEENSPYRIYLYEIME